MNRTEQLLEELMDILALKTYKQLANELEVANNTMSGWIKRDAFGTALEKVVALALQKNISMDNLLHLSGHYISQNIDQVSNTGKGVGIASISHIHHSTDNPMQEQFDKLYQLASGVDKLDRLEELLDNVKNTLLKESIND